MTTLVSIMCGFRGLTPDRLIILAKFANFKIIIFTSSMFQGKISIPTTTPRTAAQVCALTKGGMSTRASRRM